MKNILQFGCIICIALFLASCARQHQLSLVGKYKHHTTFYEQEKTDAGHVPEPDQVLQPVAKSLSAHAEGEQTLPVLKPDHQFVPPVPVMQQEDHIKLMQGSNKQVDEAETYSRQEAKRAVKSAVRQSNQAGAASKILLIILCILLPPLAVGLAKGIGWPFWLSLILTLCFWIPGVIYALIVILGD